MRNISMLLLLIFTAAASAVESKHEQVGDQHLQMGSQIQSPLQLKDGSFVFVDEKGTMRMTDKNGKPKKMHENVKMEMKDGSLIMMKNTKRWRHVHRKTK